MSRRRPENAGLLRREAAVAGLLLITVVAAGIFSPRFLSLGTLRDLLVQSAPALIVGCGLTLVIVAGEIDISVGSLMGLLAAVMGILASPQRMHWPIAAVIAATLAAGAAVGVLNGVLVVFGRVPSILVTLGMLTLLRGITEELLGGEWITDLPPGLRELGRGDWVGVPISVWTAGTCLACMMLFAHGTQTGRRMYAVGDHAEAARLAGLPVGAVRIMTFALTGTLTALAALVSVPQLSVIESGYGSGFELFVVTAVVVGGTSIRGGAGTIAGTALAALLLGSVGTVLIHLKLGDAATYWERAVQGVFILAAVMWDHARLPRRAGGGSRGTDVDLPASLSREARA